MTTAANDPRFEAAMHVHTLRTSTGERVVDVWVPPFSPYPDVLRWGDRFFVWDAKRTGYFEGMCFVIPWQLELKQHGKP